MPDYTAIFEMLGVYARAFTQFDNLARRDLLLEDGGETFRSLDRLRREFLEVLNDSGPERDRVDAVQLLTQAAQIVTGWELQLAASLDAWLREGLAAELSMQSAAPAELVSALQRAMLADAESVAANTVAVGAVNASAGNAGDAACYVTARTVDAAETELDDERIRTQRIELACTRDAAHHRVPVGQEEFRIRPQVGAPSATRVIPVTVGDVPDARNVVLDGAFDDFAAGEFAHWAKHAGGAVFAQETTLKLFGAGCLQVTGDGLTAGDLRQDLADRDPALESGRMFALGAWVRVVSHTAGEVVIEALIDGTPGTLQLTVDGLTPTGQWLHLGGFEYLPRASFPNKVILRVTCSADFDGEVLVDGLSFAPATEVPHAGLRVAVFQGALAPQALPVADRYTVDTSSDEAGAFQTFARDRLGAALPSDATPTIDDTLAE